MPNTHMAKALHVGWLELRRNVRLWIVTATALAFCYGLIGSFHFDDYSLFSNPVVTSPDGWAEAWTPLQTRPLTYFTFWLNYQLGGQNPIGYHILNLAIHLFNIWLLYAILRELTNGRIAAICTILFALHPIQSEPVLYVFERATLLATFFCLLCWREWLARRYWLAVLWFGLALLSKEECVTFPFFLCFFGRAIVQCASMLALSLAAGVRVLVASAVYHTWAVNPTASPAVLNAQPSSSQAAGVWHLTLAYFQSSLLPYVCTEGRVILRYLALIVAPYGFSIDPEIPAAPTWEGWLAWVVLIAAAVVLWRKRPYGFWFAAGLILLAPSSSVFPAADLAAYRRLYLPLVAFGTLAAYALQHIRVRAFIPVLAIVLALLTVGRCRVWLTDRSLWTEAVERAPGKVRPLLQLSKTLPPEPALGLLDKAERLAPNDGRPCEERGLRLLEMGRAEDALRHLNRAAALLPEDPEAQNNRGVALTFLGEREEAAQAFRAALRIRPCFGMARRNLQRIGLADATPCQMQN